MFNKRGPSLVQTAEHNSTGIPSLPGDFPFLKYFIVPQDLLVWPEKQPQSQANVVN